MVTFMHTAQWVSQYLRDKCLCNTQLLLMKRRWKSPLIDANATSFDVASSQKAKKQTVSIAEDKQGTAPPDVTCFLVETHGPPSSHQNIGSPWMANGFHHACFSAQMATGDSVRNDPAKLAGPE